MYHNGVYTITECNAALTGGSWKCVLVLDNQYTVEGYGYTVRGAVFNANRKMDKKKGFYDKMTEHPDVLKELTACDPELIRSIMGDTIVSKLFETVERKVAEHDV